MGSPMLPPPGPLAGPSVGVPFSMTPPGPGALGLPPRPVAAGSSITCPRCNTPTPVGFAYCQQCGLHMQGMQPTDPGQDSRPNAMAPMPTPAAHHHIDPQAATMAADGVRAGSIQPPAAVAANAAGWGTAILVNRDGSDGPRFALASEYVVIGRTGADIAFEDDRFLARQHARIERTADGAVRVVPLDALNGVFKKADAPVELADGATVLVGREVLRFERVEPEEMKVHPLVRHGVALFGSPPREPWGRVLQLVPNGGHRDVRHLVEKEIVLGREEGDIVFRDDAFMSRRHAALTWDGSRARITDLGSSNGTFVRIADATALKHGDHVRLGDQLLRIELGR